MPGVPGNNDASVKRERSFLYAVVCVSGFTSLAFEMLMGRLLAPFFGVSNLVWACIVSVVLVYITAGSILGGRLADRLGGRRRIYGVIPSLAALLSSLMVLPGYLALRAIFSGGFVPLYTHLAALVLSLFALSLPVLLVSMLLPAMTRIISGGDPRPGGAIGRAYAVNTAGSVAGAVSAVLLMVPLAGISWSVYGLTLLLALCGIGFIVVYREEKIGAAAGACVALSSIVAAASIIPFIFLNARLAPRDLVYEAETSYNRIQVFRYRDSVSVTVNDPHFAQSVGCESGDVWIDPWHAMLLAPVLAKKESGSVLILGYGSGSIAALYRRHWPGFTVRGVEIDPGMVEAGRRFVLPAGTRDRVDIGDARSALYGMKEKYDIIICDVYRFPYIPHHVTTAEFAALARRKLAKGGVLAFNCGRYGRDDSLARAVASSLGTAFPTVCMLEVGSYNTILFAGDVPVAAGMISAAGPLMELAVYANKNLREYRPLPGDTALTDDKGYSEFITHLMGVRFLLAEKQ